MANKWLLCSSISTLESSGWEGYVGTLLLGSGYYICRIAFPALSTLGITPANITGVNIELLSQYNSSNFPFTSYLHMFTGTNYYDGVIGQQTINTAPSVYSIIPFSSAQLNAIKNFSSAFYLTIGSSTGFAGFTGTNDSLNKPALNITYSSTSSDVKVSGVWKSGATPIKVGGVYRSGVSSVKVAGVWKQGI